MIGKTTPKLFLAIGALTLWAGLASAELKQVVGVAAGDTLNVRSGPGAKFAEYWRYRAQWRGQCFGL